MLQTSQRCRRCRRRSQRRSLRRVFGFLHIFEVLQKCGKTSTQSEEKTEGREGGDTRRSELNGKESQSKACKQIKRLLLGRRPMKSVQLKAKPKGRSIHSGPGGRGGRERRLYQQWAFLIKSVAACYKFRDWTREHFAVRRTNNKIDWATFCLVRVKFVYKLTRELSGG